MNSGSIIDFQLVNLSLYIWKMRDRISHVLGQDIVLQSISSDDNAFAYIEKQTFESMLLGFALHARQTISRGSFFINFKTTTLQGAAAHQANLKDGSYCEISFTEIPSKLADIPNDRSADITKLTMQRASEIMDRHGGRVRMLPTESGCQNFWLLIPRVPNKNQSTKQ